MAINKKSIIIISVTVVLIAAIGIFAFKFFAGDFSGANKILPDSAGPSSINTSPLEEVTLNFALPGFQPPASRAILDELEKKANKELNVKLNFKWNDAKDTIRSYDIIKQWNDSEIQFDAYCLSSYVDIGNDVRNAIRDGFIIDIKDLFPKYAPRYYKNFSTKQLASATFEGKLGAVPCYLPNSSRRYAFVREDLMKKYNIPEINSIDGYEVFLKTIKQRESGTTPMYLSIFNDPHIPYFYDTSLKLFAESFGYVVMDYGLGIVYKWDDPQMKLMAWEETPEYKAAVQRMKSWRDNGFCDKDGNYFDKSKYASYISTKFDMLMTEKITKVSSSADIRFKAYPLFPDRMSQRDNSFNGGIAVSSKSKNPERVLMFIDWLQSSQENYDLLLYGIKGKNYVLYGDQYDLPKNGESDDLTYINWDGCIAFTNMNNDRTNIMDSPDLKKSYIDDIQTKSKFAPHSGFIEDIKPVEVIARDRVLSYCSIEEAIREESFTNKTIDDYINENKKNGVDKLLDTLQKQLDEWKAANKN